MRGSDATIRGLLLGCCLLLAPAAHAQDDVSTRRLAEAFSAPPALWNVRLSPDGTRTAQIQARPDGTTELSVQNVADASRTTVMSAFAGQVVIEDCGWVSDTRLLCVITPPFVAEPLADTVTRSARATLEGGPAQAAQVSAPPPSVRMLAAVNSDGTEPAELATFRWNSSGSPVIDWLPDDPRAVLVRTDPEEGPLLRLNVYTGESVAVSETAGWAWLTDGRGTARIQARLLREKMHDPRERGAGWFVRHGPDGEWIKLFDLKGTVTDRFVPYGLVNGGTDLLYGSLQGDTLALFALDLDRASREPDLPLASRNARLVAGDPAADVQGVTGIGPARRPAYTSFGWGQVVFDSEAREAIERFRRVFPEHEIGIVDENADGTQHVFLVRAPNEAGAYYHYDAEEGVASLLALPFPALAEIKVAGARTVAIPDGSGSFIGGVLFEPYAARRRPSAVVLTEADVAFAHSDLDALAEFLAAQGHVVLRLAKPPAYCLTGECLEDLTLGAHPAGDVATAAAWLAESELAEPDRICVVGKSSGRLLALAASVLHEGRFRCAASIGNLVMAPALGRYAGTTSIHTPAENLRLPRLVRELRLPVFLAYARDENVAPRMPFFELAAELDRLDRPHEAVEYAPTDDPADVQVDMFTRLAAFLNEHLDD